MPNYCYILYNDRNMKTYVGYTVDPHRRLRQHNGEIVGGAKYTTRQVALNQITWKHLCILACADQAFDNHKALSCEWHLKHPDGKRKAPTRFNGPRGKLSGVAEVLKHVKFADFNITVHICDTYYEYGVSLLPTALRIKYQAPILMSGIPEVACGQDHISQEEADDDDVTIPSDLNS